LPETKTQVPPNSDLLFESEGTHGAAALRVGNFTECTAALPWAIRWCRDSPTRMPASFGFPSRSDQAGVRAFVMASETKPAPHITAPEQSFARVARIVNRMACAALHADVPRAIEVVAHPLLESV
jgi:hypothetical protein